MIEIEHARALWIYKDWDKGFLPGLEQTLKEGGFPHCQISQNETHIQSDSYVQYLCSCYLAGPGDVVHLWRDGQTWWPCSGDYSLDEEEKVEQILREAIDKFEEERRK